MHNYLQIFISLFAIMNPLLALTVYLNITQDLNRAHKRLVIIVCGVTVFIILTLFLFIGESLLGLLDIHPYALQLGGGVLILLIGITTILKQDDKKSDTSAQKNVTVDRKRVISLGVSPLALPMVVGPGGIVMIILFGQDASTIYSKLAITGIIMILSILVILFFSLADIISKFLGDLGILVMSKMLGLLLTAIAFELLISGIRGALPIIIRAA